MERGHGWLGCAALAACAACAVLPGGALAAGQPSLDPPVLKLPSGFASKQVPLPEDDGRTVLVRLRGGASAEAVARGHGARLGAVVSGTGFRRLVVPSDRLHGTFRALARDRRVAEAALNRRRSTEAVPNDPWPVKTGGQNWQQTVRLPAAWDATKGSAATTVAIVDTGVDLDHRDLAPSIVAGRDVVHGDDRADDMNGHGTFVAGLAAAATDNGIGVAGTAWTASIMPVQVLDDHGEGFDDDIATGITWAADHGADVINLSLSGPGDSPVLQAAVDHARAQGALVVAAAGNDGTDEAAYPAAAAGVLAVTATDYSGQFTWFSNWGDHVDLAAPGTDMVGLQVAEGPRERYERDSGTSFSAPIVSGAALLVLAQHPTWTSEQVAARLRDTAREAGPLGHDPYYGAGVLDVAAATGAAAPPAWRPPRASEASEPNDTPDRTTPAPLSVNFEGRFAPEGDVDWYSVQVPAAGWLYVGGSELTPFDGERTEETDVALELYGPNLEKVGEADGEGPAGYGEELFHYVKTPGRFYVRARNALGSQGSYGISVTQGTTPSVSDARLTAGQWYPTGSWPSTVTTGDVTGDGRRDVLMTTTAHMGDEPDRDYKLFVFRQDADGWLERRQILDLDGLPQSVATGDMDGDGRTDAVVPTGLGVEILHQSGGELGAGEFVFTGNAWDADIVDLDGDGDRDMVTSGGGRVHRVLNTAAGWSVQPVASLGAEEVEVGDVTGDGRPDVVGIGTFGVYVVAQTSTGRWAEAVRYGGPLLQCQCLRGLELAELTGDGRLDVAATSSFDDHVAVVPQTSTGTLGDPRAVSAGPNPEPVEAADLDGDGRSDLAIAAGGYQQLTVLRQTSPGAFGPVSEYRAPYASHYEPNGLATGDITGDGRQDVVMADYNHGLVVNRNAEGAWPVAANGAWVRSATPADGSEGNAASVVPTVRFGRAMDASTVTTANVRLATSEGAAVASAVSYDATSRVATIRPSAALASGSYVVSVSGLRSSAGASMPGMHRTRFRVGTVTDTTAPDTVIDAGSLRTISVFAAHVTFHATEPAATFECAVDSGAYERCESPWFEFGDTVGTHTIRVRATDPSGNVDTTPAQHTFVVYDSDFHPPNDFLPQSPTVAGETGTASGTNRSANKDEWELDHAGNPGGASVWWRWTAPRSGPVTFETTGSSFDTLLGVSTGPVDMTRAEFQNIVASNDDAGPGVVTSRVTFLAAAGQTYNVAVDGFNALGYAPATGDVDLRWSMGALPADTTAPQTTIVEGPPSPTREFKATRFRFASDESDATFECRRGETGRMPAPWNVCFPGVLYEELGDGDWTFEVRAVDAAGNRDPTPASHRWMIDLRAPVVTSLSGTSGTTSATTASFSWAVDDATAPSSCRLDGGPWQACTSPRALAGLAEGHHRFDVRAVDAAGNVAVGRSATWTIDPAAPALDTRLFGGPPQPTTQHWAFFDFTATRALATFECKLDSAPWSACDSPHYINEGLPDGVHTLSVRAVDGTEVDSTPATRTWTIGDPPSLDTTITDGPESLTSSRSASLAFTSNRSSATFECQIDGAPFAPCISPKPYTSLADGSHTFAVRAVDGTTTDTTPATRTWTVDTTPPVVEITAGPTGTVTSRDASFGFTVSGATSIACSIDSGAFAACASPKSYTSLGDGSHTFTVRGSDVAGNTATASQTWTISPNTPPPPPPPAAPDTAIDDGPSGLTASRTATFAFGSADSVDRFECQLDGSAWGTCTSPRELSGLGDGTHTFAVRAVNAGGADPSPAQRSWTVDATAPQTQIDAAPPPETTDATPEFDFSSSEPAVTYACRIDDGPEYPCTAPHTSATLTAGPHRFGVRATDAAGNADATPATADFAVVEPQSTPPGEDDSGGSGTSVVRPPADNPSLPPTTTSDSSVEPPPPDALAPALERFRPSFDTKRRRVRVQLRTSEAGVLSIRFERCRARGRRRCAIRRRIGSQARRVKAGTTSFSLTSWRVRPGRYRMTASVTDEAGNVSARRTAEVVVVRPRRR